MVREITVSFDLTRSELNKALRVSSLRSAPTAWGPPLLIAVLLFEIWEGSVIWIAIIAVVLCSTILITTFPAWIGRGTHTHARPEYLRGRRITVTEHGFDTVGGFLPGHRPWERLTWVRETGGVYSCAFKPAVGVRRQVVAIPRRAFVSVEDEEGFKSLVRTHSRLIGVMPARLSKD